ncbi:uncharacterized protein LOC132564819 [Ylistrum balloti]|uniref:uncharacterized protein LOC132564819 n=1 Tax=Ylistrum balloti TaxID=509963 RepID=UPI0029057ED9|nr:uncharacterized protein LOC132564819 [Ylistrum balloti]
MYTALIRSKLDYGCQVYDSASDNALKPLDSIQHQALKVALGAVRNTPSLSLLAESGELPLKLRREKLILKYWARTQVMGPSFPPCKIVKNTENKAYRNKLNKHQKPPYMFRIHEALKEHKLDKIKIEEYLPNPTPPWLLKQPEVNIDILNTVNKKENPIAAKHLSLDIISKFEKREHYYTDGSKNPDNNRAGFGIFCPQNSTELSIRISDNCSVYSSEIIAIGLALRIITVNKPKNGILSDSLSSLISISTGNGTRNTVLTSIQNSINQLSIAKIPVTLMYVPAHVGIPGNDKADQLAKNALHLTEITQPVSLTKEETYSLINKSIQKKWDDIWLNSDPNQPLRKIQDKPSKKAILYSENKTEDKIITKLRLGYTKLKENINKMIKNTSPNCTHCNALETISHVFTECQFHSTARNNWKKQLKKEKLDDKTLIELLRLASKNQVARNLIISFIREIGYIDKI